MLYSTKIFLIVSILKNDIYKTLFNKIVYEKNANNIINVCNSTITYTINIDKY